MLDSGERAYAYSKACGIVGKSFVGKRLPALAGLRSLNELDRLVFSDPRTDLPGRELLLDIENRILKRAVSHIVSVLKSYRRPPALLVRQLRVYEYADLKTCLHYLQAGKKKLPVFAGLGAYGTVRFQFFPDLRAMLENTEFDFILNENTDKLADGNFDLTSLETEMDTRYYTALKNDLLSLSGEDCAIARRILADEISLRNCIWAFRLRSYFEKTPEEASRHLMDITLPRSEENFALDMNGTSAAHGREVSLALEAQMSLGMPMDMRDAWDGWRWEKFLNPEMPDEMWTVDPRYFQNAASLYLYNAALRCLHDMPLAVSAIFCFIKLKIFEEEILTSVAEGLGLGLPCAEVFELLEVSV